MPWLVLVPIVVAAGFAAAIPRILRRLPPPSDEPDGDHYRPLATRRFALTGFGLCAAAGVLAVLLAPAQSPGWIGLSTLGVLAGMVDARTGFLPKRLIWGGWVLTGVGLGVAALIGQDGWLLLRVAIGTLAATTLFWLFWWFGGGFGFGDVRLAPMIGATAASVDYTMLAGGLLFGSLAGLAWGLAWQISGRGKAFPYGPALVAGPFLALALRAALGVA